ncbi:MAG: hypothetical protein HY855_02840 [Burkholderiales bacterium]|nr:hypothetical protein [Burkholderiales bacterium]
MRISDTLAQWYGSAEVAARVLAGRLGDVERSIGAIARSPTWCKTHGAADIAKQAEPAQQQDAAPAVAAAPRQPRSEVRKQLVQMASSELGVTNGDAARELKIDITQISSQFGTLVLAGLIVKVKVAGALVRYFAHRDDAMQYAAEWPGARVSEPVVRKRQVRPPKSPVPAAVVPTRQAPAAQPTARREPAAPPKRPATPAPEVSLAPVRNHPVAKPVDPIEVITPEGVRRIVAAPFTHDPRYQCDPSKPVVGAGFSSLGIGRYHR